MPCYHPLPGWYGRDRTEKGLRPVVFTASQGYLDRPVEVPCGRCIGCRLERSRQWAIRCMHEAQMHKHNAFVTLTYDNDHLPAHASLQPSDFVLFMKRLRKAHGNGIRFFQCGEYGDENLRPHHHAILFNCHFHDQRLLPNKGNPLFESTQLHDLWQNGRAIIGAVNFETAAYVARYSLKKITGPTAAEHYNGRTPEYATMSRRPGIGSSWLAKYKSDVYPNDTIIIRGGIKCRPPRYYDDQLPQRELRSLKYKRRTAQANNPENSGKRLIVREHVTTAQISNLQRDKT